MNGISWNYSSRQKSLGHLEETDKKPLSSTYCHGCYKHAPPFSLEHCWFACGTLEVGMYAKFSHYRWYFSRKPTLFQGERGMRVRCRIQKVQCPRTFGEYCLVLKFFITRYTCNVLVGQGVIDGAENDGDI